jgi:hypothetical protein
VDDASVRAAIGRAFLEGAAWTWSMNHPRVGDVVVDEHQGDELEAAAAACDCGAVHIAPAKILEDGVPPARLVDELRAIRAQGDLVRWALVTARRDELVAAAAAAGVTKTQIHRLTGIARTTIDRITGTAPR